MYHLGDRSLWFDEAVTANTSRGTLTQMLGETRSRLTSPIIYPCILYIVEKIAINAVAVRAPSVLASLLAIFVMLAMVRARVTQIAALVSAAILTISASQIRYAQEVREYSLSVLWSACLIYCFLRWEAAGSRRRQPFFLYIAIFLAPFIQYGLVFLVFGILSTIALRLLSSRETRFRLSHVVSAFAFLTAGSLLSFVLTLHDQYRAGGRGHWYLASNYFDPKTTSLLHFVGTNSKGLLSFLIPGQLVVLGFVFGAVILCITQIIGRRFDSITVLVFTSVSIAICASMASIYPYGGIRQCLFLAPLLILFAGIVFADLLQRFPVSWKPAATVAFLTLVLLSGYRGMLRQWPYSEYEDTLTILRYLDKSSGPNDEVWVNHDAVESVDFYLQRKDHRFIYGKFHGDAPQKYVPELIGSIDRRRDRVWLVFSHLQQPSDHAEEQLIVNSLPSNWDVHLVVAPVNTALFVANRRNISPDLRDNLTLNKVWTKHTH
jgi:uncharacterized membrane protein